MPSTVRGRRRGRFHVDIDNRADDTVDLELRGEGPGLDVKLKPERLRLYPGPGSGRAGECVVRGISTGERRQHAFTVTATQPVAELRPGDVPAAFAAPPTRLRTLLVVLTVVAVWAAALGAGYLWLQQRDDAEPDADVGLIDTNGDGCPDTPADELVDTDGDGDRRHAGRRARRHRRRRRARHARRRARRHRRRRGAGHARRPRLPPNGGDRGRTDEGEEQRAAAHAHRRRRHREGRRHRRGRRRAR